MFPTTSFEHVFVRIDSKQYLGGFYTKGDECGDREKRRKNWWWLISEAVIGLFLLIKMEYSGGLVPEYLIICFIYFQIPWIEKWTKKGKKIWKMSESDCIENAVFESFEEKIPDKIFCSDVESKLKVFCRELGLFKIEWCYHFQNKHMLTSDD